MINEVHEIIKDTIRKTSSYKSPEQIDRALNRALIDYQSFLLNPSGNINPQSLERYVSKKDSNSHTFSLPDDFVKEITIESKWDGKVYGGEILSEQEFNDRRNSSLVGPELSYPIARLNGNSIEVLPEDGNYTLKYYRKPIKCKYNYTVAQNGRDIVFDPNGSVDLDCNENAQSEIISRALLYLGISLQAENLIMEERLKDGN